MSIAAALASLRPMAAWRCLDGTYATLQWLDATQTKPTQADVEAEVARLADPVPAAVTSGAFIRAAHEMGWLDGIDSAVGALGAQNSLIPRLWGRASQFERGHPLVAAVAQAMGKTSAEVDGLFRRAGGYDA